MPNIGWYHDKSQSPFKLFLNIKNIPCLDLRPTLDDHNWISHMPIAPMPLLGHVDPKELNKDLNISCKPLKMKEGNIVHQILSSFCI